MYVKLARAAAEHYVRAGELLPLPNTLPAEMLRQRACYVTVFEKPGRHVRSLFGRPLPQQPMLAQEIVVNTIEAITQSRQRLIRRADLSSLLYSVAVLGPLQRVSHVEHLHPDHFGLYLESDRGKSALLLPQRAGVETAADQVATAMREAGIDGRAEAVTMYRFEVTYFDE